MPTGRRASLELQVLHSGVLERRHGGRPGHGGCAVGGGQSSCTLPAWRLRSRPEQDAAGRGGPTLPPPLQLSSCPGASRPWAFQESKLWPPEADVPALSLGAESRFPAWHL